MVSLILPLYPIHDSEDDKLREGEVEETSQLSPSQDAAIHLPASIFKQIDRTDIGAIVGYYETATLFPISGTNNSLRQVQVCSNIVAATVGHNISIQNLQESVSIAFRIQNKQSSVEWPIMLTRAFLTNNINLACSTWLREMCQLGLRSSKLDFTWLKNY